MLLNDNSILKAVAVETALLKVFNINQVTEMILLAGGLSGSSVYKITIDDQSYLLKLDPSGDISTAMPGALQLAASAGVAPHLYYRDKIQGVTISDFIDNKPIRDVFAPDKLISELALTIKAIHAIPFHNSGPNLFETVDRLINRFKQGKILHGPIVDECFYYYALIKNKYPCKDEDKVFSHNDLNPNNILCDGKKIWIIDWDAACLNDRYIDLANTANFFVHTEEQEKAYLGVYFNSDIDDYKMACVYIMRQLCRIVYAMLMFQLCQQGKPAGHLHDQEMEGIDLKTFGALMAAGKLTLADYEGQLTYGKALLNEAVYYMRTPRFKASLSQFE